MTHGNRFFGKIALLTVMLVGLVGVSTGSAFASAGGPKQKTKATPAATTMKKTAAAPATPKKAKTAKKKRHHARRSAHKRTKKS